MKYNNLIDINLQPYYKVINIVKFRRYSTVNSLSRSVEESILLVFLQARCSRHQSMARALELELITQAL